MGNSEVILKIDDIKEACNKLFSKSYPEIECAFLFGSYARNEATEKSDIDILVVLDKPMGMKFFGIATDLSDALHKEIDLKTYEQIVGSVPLVKDILVEGIKIYSRR